MDNPFKMSLGTSYSGILKKGSLRNVYEKGTFPTTHRDPVEGNK